jgi:hypothetical protein
MKFKLDFKHIVPFVSMRTGFDVDVDAARDVEMETTVEIDPEHLYGGWYETFDVATGGHRFYTSGILETLDTSDGEGNKGVALVGYDGCYELPDYIIKALEEKGVIIDL